MTEPPVAAVRGFRALLGEPRWRALVESGTARRFRAGEFLVRQGDPGGFLLVLAEGRVIVNARDAAGAELLLALRAHGDLIGEMAMRDTAARTATVTALDDCTAWRLSDESFRRFLAAHDAQGEYSDYLVGKLSETVPYQMRLVHFSARQRVARLLLEVVALAGPGEPSPRRVPFSQEAVAGSLGLARSTVAEQIAALRADGALTPGPRLVVADAKALTRHAGVTMTD
ncbi:MAG TPA: Crp/Fnr family transcriptional regulator [Pseudonocardiaceae bacterium]|jgi:CRP-like cAMP-binding protein|nr:Crp/Fnr family transcriptional regulator [Pseudonocardiaceae bacterium]